MLNILADAGGVGNRHFERPDDTTVRLVGRCIGVDWLRDTAEEAESNDAEKANEAADEVEAREREGRGHAELARKRLELGPREASVSSLSMQEMVVVREKPGVVAPSRTRAASNGEECGSGEEDEADDPFND